MPNVVRFALSTARDQYISGVGFFRDGILDVDANRLDLVKRARYLVQPYRAVEIGIVDSAAPKPTLPAPQGPPAPNTDPYPQYLTAAEVIASTAIRSEFVLRADIDPDPDAFTEIGQSNSDPNSVVRRDGSGSFVVYRIYTGDTAPDDPSQFVPKRYVDGRARVAPAHLTVNSGVNDGRWSKIATITLPNQYADVNVAHLVVGSAHGGAEPHMARVLWRVKQDGPSGQDPNTSVKVWDVGGLTPSDFAAVIESNAGPVVVTLWIRDPHPFSVLHVYEEGKGQFGGLDYAPSDQPQQVSLPAGTIVPGTYAAWAGSPYNLPDTVARRDETGQTGFRVVVLDDATDLGGPQVAVRKDYVDVLTSISAAPPRFGKLAVVGGVGYMATGTGSAADWKVITA